MKGLAAAIASIFAALVSIASFARSMGFLGGADDAALALAARWVGVAPAQDTAWSVGDTIYLAATVTGRAGASLVGVPIGWSSDVPAVATVNEDGVVVARGPGTTTIVATVGTIAGRSRITVKQRVAWVRIAGDSGIAAAEGTRTPLSVRASDARGHVIQGRVARWITSDSTVAHIDSLGQLVAVAPGQAALTATIDGISTQAPVTVSAVPGSLNIVSGGQQRALAGTALRHPLAVRVLDRRGKPIAGVAVRFRDPTAASVLDPEIAFTDVDGHARTSWTLGPMPGRQRALATVDHVDSALALVADAEPHPGNVRIGTTGADKRVTAGAMPDAPLVVTLTDTTGRPLVDVPVTWLTNDGGSVEPALARTDSVGQARTQWTPGRRAGSQKVIVRVGSGAIPPHEIDIAVRPGAPAKIAVTGGNAQDATVGAKLGRPIAIRITDSLGNAIAGVKVTLEASAGTLTEKALTTDTTGSVEAYWTLGRTAGVQRLTARAVGIAAPLEVTATALPAAAASVKIAELPAEATAGARLKDTVWVTVTDSFGNPVPKTPVVFAATAGTLSATRGTTDARGRAATRWTLGRTAGQQTVSAVVRGTTLKAARAVRAKAAPARPAATQGTARRSGAAAPSSPSTKG